jgi:pimeloyl-ACP methyl ester carboxylesterase
MRIVKRLLYWLVALSLIAVVSGCIYQSVMEARDDRRFPPPGKLVDVDGHLMHIFCHGKGSPTVVVEQGIGVQATRWTPLNARLAEITTVCAYDRAGMGYSEPVGHPTPSTEVASNLHKLLRNAGITDGIVLVGWSAGGMYAREFYRQFPGQVQGMVLVDSSHEQQRSRMPFPDVGSFNTLKLDGYLAPIGWMRLSGKVEGWFANSALPESLRDRLIALNLRSHMPRARLAEVEGFESDLAANRSPPNLGSLPLVVLSQGKPDDPFMQENLKTWFGLQDELAHLSTNGSHIVATQSAHAIFHSEPDLIVNAVRDVVTAVR